MKSGILFVLIFLLTAISLPAQEASSEPPPPKNGLEDSVQGVFVTPVEGVPFSATVEIKDETLIADGRIETSHTINQIARDNAGRIHNEIRQMMPEGFTGVPPIVEVHIFDPRSGLNTYYDPRTRVASQAVLSRPPSDLNAGLLAAHKAQSKNLGATVLSGIECLGTLKTYATPAPSNGTDKPVIVTDEFWYSGDLQINILMRHTVSLGGEKIVAVTEAKRGPPDPALFEVPEGYRIVDVTPPPSTLVRRPMARR